MRRECDQPPTSSSLEPSLIMSGVITPIPPTCLYGIEGNKFTFYFYRLVVGVHLHAERQTCLKMVNRLSTIASFM